MYRAAQIVKSMPHIDSLNDDWLNVGSTLLLNKPSGQVCDADLNVIAKVKDFYLGNGADFGRDTTDQLVELIGDSYVFGPNEYFVKLVLQSSAQPVYSYRYSAIRHHQRII